MKRASAIVGILVGFLFVHWTVAILRADFLPSRWDASPETPELAPEPANDVPSPGFEVFDHLLPFEGLVAYRFARARSITEMNDVRRAVYQEHVSRWKVASGPLPTWIPTMLAALLDPLVLIIGAAAGYGILVAGGGALLIGVAAGAAGLSAGELVLQVQQYTRSDNLLVAVLIYCAAMVLVACTLDWIVRRYGRQLWRPVYVLTRGTCGIVSSRVTRGWRALEDESDR